MNFFATTFRWRLQFFKNAKVYLYDDSLSVYKEKSFTAPDSYASAADWQKNFTKEVVNIRAEDGGTVLVHHLIIAEGNLYADGTASVPGGDN